MSPKSVSPPPSRSAFTLIELLVVIAIIAILAGLGFSGVSGALKTARKAEVRAMANQVKLALTAYYADYGVWPTNEKTDANFLNMITGQSTTTGNKRAIRYLEPAAKFTNGSGLVTPVRFYATGQSNFTVIVDTNYDGKIEVVDANSGAKTNISGSVALYVKDPDKATGYITTY